LSVVLATGATGYVGRHAVSRLAERGFEVHATTRCPRHALAGARLHTVDLLDGDSVLRLISRLRPTHMLLSAWTTEHGKYWTDPDNERWADLSEAMARAFFDAGGRRVVLAGSCAEYDWSDPELKQRPIREDLARGVPRTPYGCAKRRTAERLSRLAAAAGREFAVGRIFFPIGTGEKPDRFLPSIIRAVLEERPAKLGPCDQVRDVTDVRDTGSALAAIVESSAIGAINIGSGRGVRLDDLASRVAAALGRPELLEVGASPPRQDEPPALVADDTRLREEVAFRLRYTLEDAIAASIRYWRSKR
jgi:nucleoside-diphosphate-sugar epimerase